MSRPNPLLLLCVLSLGLLSQASLAAEQCENLNGQPINFQVRWPQVWEALDQRSSCTQNCHLGTQPTAELDFSNAQLSIYFLVEQLSFQDTNLKRVEPGDPQRSLLFQKINCRKPAVGDPMPPPDGHVPLDLQGLIYDWIEQGALGELAEDPIPRTYVFRDSLESIRCVPRADGKASDRSCTEITLPWRGPRS